VVVRRSDRWPRPVGEQTPEVHIAAFGDAAEPPMGAAGIFPRRQSQPARKLARGGALMRGVRIAVAGELAGLPDPQNFTCPPRSPLGIRLLGAGPPDSPNCNYWPRSGKLSPARIRQRSWSMLQAMSAHPKSLEPAKCLWCGLLVEGVPHRSDTDCISALRDAVKLHKSALEVSGAAANRAKTVPRPEHRG
jgi:hypothetical protein